MPNRHHGPPKRRLPMTWHAHNNHTPPLHAHPRLRRRDSATPTGGFTTIDTPPRRVAGVSHPYGRNSPRAHPQPPPRPVQTPIAYDLARTQQPHATPARPSAAPPPRLGHANGGFYYHRRPTTACRRRVAALWSQFPPRAHPQPPTTRPSNNAAPRTPRATPIHNLTIAAFADATATRPRQRGILLP